MEPFAVIEVPGPPVAKGRARTTVVRGRGGRVVTTKTGAPMVKHYTPEKTRQWEKAARTVAQIVMRGRKPSTEPLAVTIIAILPVPPSWPAWKQAAALAGHIAATNKPDLDNIVKAAKDALNGVVWVDDAQAIGERTLKRYGDNPRVIIKVERTGKAPANISSKRQAIELCPAIAEPAE